jgi:hypothetical protein
VQVTSNEYFTVADVAALLKLSKQTVIKLFENRAGVLRLGHGETRFKRRHWTLRIPREALDALVLEGRVQ